MSKIGDNSNAVNCNEIKQFVQRIERAESDIARCARGRVKTY